MKIHHTLAALMLAISTTAWSDVTNGQAVDPLAPATGQGATQSAGNWSGALEKNGNDATSADLAKDLSAEARILNEHLANVDKADQNSEAKKPGAKAAAVPGAKGTAQPGATAVVPNATENKSDDWGGAWAKMVKDFFKPLHKEVVNSEVVQAARELDSIILKKKESDEMTPVAAPPIVSPRASMEPRQRDKNADAIAVEEFINEVKPYAYSALALAIVGYIGVVIWRFLRWKQVKSDKRIRRSRAARKSRSRSEASDIRGDEDSPASRSAGLASRAAPLASRAAPLQSDTQNDRLSA